MKFLLSQLTSTKRTPKENRNLDAYLGLKGKVVELVEQTRLTGRIQIRSEYFQAISSWEHSEKDLPKGTSVEVVGTLVHGKALIVKPL